MEADELGITERGERGFGSSSLNPKRSMTTQAEGICICFLQEESNDNQFFNVMDIGYHPRLMQEKEMLASAQVNAALTSTINNTFLDKIKVAGKEDRKWQERGGELVRLRESGKWMPNEWTEDNKLR